MSVPDLTFVLGGARSGKSAFAERLAEQSGLPVTYLATAAVSDEPEMRARIAHHRARRPAHWTSVEVGRDLAGALRELARDGRCVLVDCLPLWLAGWLCPPDDQPDGPADDAQWQAAVESLAQTLAALPGKTVVVSNEIGMGVIPMGALTRRYVDELGRLNQRVAALAPRVRLVVAGLPMAIKG
ncbi:bifunctional adenosylcobinamide kinase/adenosylcobinamide-phosphate guanylyltransferase [Pandoraea nosoerga]|uniref:Bifunctional adenosylcobalamin biosynthesis protein n=1 Tax=Pandoraea nosoerga TaxID=2508296 RepID=A0A5E4W7C0_9BURK|nr:bifunctional adenosylcobinamide kinase/adenosylcobinamide-phosphate guanylyltransferase [Pandoraea nosoerga]MBN4667746.1 bifunctional adenosylcobinamide kinase/adenosylcobinamide-phosphate guanylyltransferase [Pandoraea nosoerga]MBN4677653.1 bifunctional adenosylcobinamide kinase/adenosylcobinamide-phosphate guanylyltransferase [Pandoraea nosoerga]MBN4682575.1 bifunctional adenosylcobinamide kinase/adenosylcobinamide-phosphate guanylyltransferase [Pandoraea nosoerga]MBN4744990.1 bifunctional